MKTLMKPIYLLVIFLFLNGFYAHADTYPNTSIAIVDLNLILSDSKAAKAATKAATAATKAATVMNSCNYIDEDDL